MNKEDMRSIHKLQVLKNGKWEYVFCRNVLTGIETTQNKDKALVGQGALDYFETKYANDVFRLS